MTAAHVTGPPPPSPALFAARRPIREAVHLAPVRRLPAPTSAIVAPVDPVHPLPPAVARDRSRFQDCSRGAHVWVIVAALDVIVCQHCPVHADQAERVRAAVAGAGPRGQA